MGGKKRVRRKTEKERDEVAIKNDVAAERSSGGENSSIGQVLNHIFTCWKI